jgi:1-deoxy-D-xylulose-5-phosphate synthase
MALLDRISEPADLRPLTNGQLVDLAGEIRDFIVQAVAETGGHLGSNLGAVELSIALHRIFESPTDAILWDTGHQAYVHKILTGRKSGFARLRQHDGISGYPSREESRHDFIENSHASTVLSYAHGLAVARDNGASDLRHIVAVIGDGSMTGGMAYEALNNLGHSKSRVIIVLNKCDLDSAKAARALLAPLEAVCIVREHWAAAQHLRGGRLYYCATVLRIGGLRLSTNSQCTNHQRVCAGAM